MNIQIRDGERNIHLSLPTKLILNRVVLRRILKCVSVNGEFRLSADAVSRLTKEIKRIQKLRGTWELVEISTAGGETVTITV